MPNGAMNGTITIRIEGQYKSISGLEWRDVPPFAVITGVNGTGKSQLLETIAGSYGQMPSRNPHVSQIQSSPALAIIEGDTFERGEVVHSYDEWRSLSAHQSSEREVSEAIGKLHTWHTRVSPNDPAHEVLESVAAQSGITVDELLSVPGTEFIQKLTPGLLLASRSPTWDWNLAFLFLSYRLFERDAKGRHLSEEEVRRLYGEPPWTLLNEILQVSGLPFRVNHPEPVGPWQLASDPGFAVRLYDIERGLEVPIADLSSGELVIMSTMIWRYAAQQIAKHPRLLLLDEPDAHLHPSLTRRFLGVVRKVFVEERGMRVIMTTHSPSTVALTPKDSLFEMRRTDPRIVPVWSKARAVAVLTDGFVAVQEATQTVLLEGKDDPPFYKLVWELLTERSVVSEPGPLEPYPSLAFVHGKGKETVETLVPQMRECGLQSFHGIIDKDVSNAPSNGVYVISRNGMENYLFDPLNVWVLLRSEDRAPSVAGVNVPRGRVANVRSLPEDQLQEIANAILNEMEGKLTNLSSEEKCKEEVVFVNVNGKRLWYPRWLLYRDDKEIKQAFSEAFGHHVLETSNPDKLLRNYGTLNMVPQDLLDLFRTIQASGNP